jgi:DNA polymerase-3 subunit alpha (Gram-positive type)
MSEPTSKELIDNLSFCVIDLETTGGNHSKDKIIEIGMVRVQNRKVVGEMSHLVNPEMPIPEFIQNLTNISQKDVKDAKVIEDIIDEVLNFIGDDIIVAHNTSFDVPFLNGVLKRLDRDLLENKVICTNVMTKHLIPEILNSNLNYMSRLFNVKHSNAHRAYDDALATAKLLVIYLDVFIDKGIKKVNQLYYPRNKFELDRTHLDPSYSNEEVVSYLAERETSTLVTIKGERGLILAVIPLENPKEEQEIVLDVLKDLDWKIITVRLIKPLIEGLFQFNNHFLKYPEETRNKLLNYLTKRYHSENPDMKKVEQIDFVMGHHLVTDQIIVYSFLHLNTNTKNLFKIPAQKKKLYQFLSNQINKFENVQKGRRKNLIHTELVPLIEHFLDANKGQSRYLFMDRKGIKDDKDSTIKKIEDFVRADSNDFNFPTQHL